MIPDGTILDFFTENARANLGLPKTNTDEVYMEVDTLLDPQQGFLYRMHDPYGFAWNQLTLAPGELGAITERQEGVVKVSENGKIILELKNTQGLIEKGHGVFQDFIQENQEKMRGLAQDLQKTLTSLPQKEAFLFLLSEELKRVFAQRGGLSRKSATRCQIAANIVCPDCAEDPQWGIVEIVTNVTCKNPFQPFVANLYKMVIGGVGQMMFGTPPMTHEPKH